MKKRNEMGMRLETHFSFVAHLYKDFFSFLKFKRQDIINSELRNGICSKYFVPFLKGPLNEFGEGVFSVYFHFCHEHVCSFSFEIEVIRPDFFFFIWILFHVGLFSDFIQIRVHHIFPHDSCIWTEWSRYFFSSNVFSPHWNRSFRIFSSRAIHFRSLPNSLCYCSTISLLSQSLSVYVLFCRTSNLLLQTCTFWIAITFSIYFVFIVIHHFAKWVDGTVRCLHKIKYFGKTHVWRWHNTPYIRFQWGLHIASVFRMKRRFFLHQFHLPISTLQIIIFVAFAVDVVVARDTKSCHTYHIKIYIRDDFVSIRSMPSAYFFLFWIIIFLPFNSHEKPKICQLNRISP